MWNYEDSINDKQGGYTTKAWIVKVNTKKNIEYLNNQSYINK